MADICCYGVEYGKCEWGVLNGSLPWFF